jgi:hypothetical protein
MMCPRRSADELFRSSEPCHYPAAIVGCMIYLHCGWPKTGTTSLQAALVKQEDRLEEAGVYYPREWRVRAGAHRFVEVLTALQEPGGPVEELERFMVGHANQDILFSSENLSVWALGGKIETFLRFLAVLREVGPIRCIWTLRRADEMLHSVFRQMTFVKGKAPDGPFLGELELGDLFAGMRVVEETVDEVTYVKYDPAGAHNAELLAAFDLSADLAVPIERELRSGARLNPSASEKAMAAVLNADRLSARTGVELDPDRMRDAFRSGFRFERDRACVLAGYEERQEKHERVLARARAREFTPYLRFFEHEEVGDRSPASRLDPEMITDEDLSGLVARVQQPVGV